jgi:hypothetical protein
MLGTAACKNNDPLQYAGMLGAVCLHEEPPP